MAAENHSNAKAADAADVTVASAFHMFDPCTATELAIRSAGEDGWWYGDIVPMCEDSSVMHSPMSNAPEGVQATAAAIRDALAGTWLPAGESETRGVVAAIEPRAPMTVLENCLEALAIKADARQLARVREELWSSEGTSAFCFEDEEEAEECGFENYFPKYVAATKIMASNLDKHFGLDFDADRATVSPEIYGGVHSQSGWLIVIVGMRVCT